jgi:putative ABC transport system ATP-binding protein
VVSAPVAQLVGVGRTFPGPNPVTALHPTDLTVHIGEWLAITGRSGSGKSTLLHLLGLLDRPTTGAYLLDGIDTAAMPDRERTRLRGAHIGFVFQSFHLLAHRSALENVILSLMYSGCPRSQRAARAAEALARVGLDHRRDALPPTLSGGERQRVATARALATEPALLLADEPTGNLDSVTADEVLALFHRLHVEGQTIVLVTHDPTVAARAHRRLHLVDGTATEVAHATPQPSGPGLSYVA